MPHRHRTTTRVCLDGSFTANELLDYIEESAGDVEEFVACNEQDDEEFEDDAVILTEAHLERIFEIMRDPSQCNLRYLKLARIAPGGSSELAFTLGNFLDVNSTLLTLDLSHMHHIADAGIDALVQPLAHASESKVTHVAFVDLRIGPKSAPHLVTLLRHSKTLVSLNLSDNDLGSKGIKAVAPAVASCTTLRSLYLSRNHLGHRGVGHLCKELRRSSIELLDLTCNNINHKGLQSICDWLIFGQKVNRTLKELCLGANNLQATPLWKTLLRRHYTLEVLRLGGNELGDEGAGYIAEGWRGSDLDVQSSPGSLQTLELDWNQIGDVGAAELSHSLSLHSTLQHLDLSGNNISDVRPLAQALPHTIQLESLTLRNVTMSDDSIQQLAESILIVSQHFRTLELDRSHPLIERAFQYKRNLTQWLGKTLQQIERRPGSIRNLHWLSKRISRFEVDKLSRTLQKTPRAALTTLYLGGKTLDSIQGLCDWIASGRNCRLQRLYITDAPLLADGGAAQLGDALAAFPNNLLKILSFTSSGVTGQGISKLTAGVARCQRLQRLTVSRNQIGDEGFVTLTQELPPSLLSLNVSCTGLTGALANQWDWTVGEQASTELRELYLDDNSLTDTSLMEFLLPLSSGTINLQLISLHGNSSLTANRGVAALRRLLPPSVVVQFRPTNSQVKSI